MFNTIFSEIPDCNCTVAEKECLPNAVQVELYDGLLSEQQLYDGWKIVTENSDPADSCGMRASIRLTKNGHGDVRVQALWIEYGFKLPELTTGENVDGEFTIEVVVCKDSGLSYLSKVEIFLIQ